MSTHLRSRLHLLLWVLLLAFGVDQGVAVAQEIHAGGETENAWMRHSGARPHTCRLLLALPDGFTALPAPTVELPPPGAWTRIAAPPERRLPPPRGFSRRSEYPRGPPA